jgi:D-alanyl-D-alanine carboxypeptidase (penicillin-binding protein 5/6)
VSERPVLEGGARRRRGARRRGALALALAVAVAAVVAGLLVGRGGSRQPTDTVSGGGGKGGVALTPAVGPVARPAYATQPAPAGQQVHVRFKHPPRAGLLFDLRSGRVLWSRNPDVPLPIASLTKMMTALVVVDREPPDASVRVTRQALAYHGSGIGLLKLGRHVDLETMLYGLLLPSGNDAAIALAQRSAGGSVTQFVGLMNARAQALGLRCSHFASPDGFADAQHRADNHACAIDLAILARELLARTRLARIVGTFHTVRPFPIKGGKVYLYNNNPLMFMRYRGVTGVKTGYTNAAGHCLVASVTRRGVRLGLVLLHSPDTGSQARKLFDAGFRRLGVR